MNFKIGMNVNVKRYLKKCLLTLILICWGHAHCLQAQESKKDKIEALRIAFITKQLDLTSKEAQAFWPVYNDYLDKVESARKAFRQQYKKNDYDFSTDKEAEDFINAEIQLKQKEAAYFKEYYEKFKKVLPVKKVALLRKAEEDFKKEIIKQLQGRGAND